MRGFPLINGALIVVALVVILVPLMRLTSAPVAEVRVATLEDESPLTPVAISVRCAHVPSELTLSHLGKLLWDSSKHPMDEGTEVMLDLPAEGIDLLVSARWPAGTPESALEVTLEPRALEGQSKVLWGEGEVDDILTFIWNE